MTFKNKADSIGMVSGILCLIHCIATPFLFITEALSAASLSEKPVWWQMTDYLFLAISFTAIYFATGNSSQRWVCVALWGSWSMLLLTILDEAFKTNLLPEAFVYIPAFLIIGLHFYNRKYCKCMEDKCCASQ